jgi:serine/threonine-protein kinase
MSEREELLSVARAIAARLPVDWATVESSTSDDALRAAVRELRIISEIADLNHGLQAALTTDPPESNEGDRWSATDDGRSVAQRHQTALGTWGPFTLLECVGNGSFGDVYLAWDSRLDREIALKLLKQGETRPVGSDASVIEEGRLLARVHHPNVVTVYGADRFDGRVGVWMEFIRGRTLEQWLLDEGPFSARAVIDMGIQICHALAAVHRAGFLHRDVKAQNVMHDLTGRLVLMDLGAGREQLGGHRASSHDLAGTPLYLAPELFRRLPPTTQCDIYSVGVLLYHLLSGTYPVTGRSVRELRDRHRSASPVVVRDVLADVPEALAGVIRRSLDLEPTRRFRSAEEMATALAAINAPVTPAGHSQIAWAAPVWAAGSLVVVAAILLNLNVGGWRDRVLGRLAQPTSRRDPVALTEQFGVREVLRSGEYFDLGRPSADGRYFPLLDHETADVVVKDLQTGELRRLTKSGDAEGYTDGTPAISPDDRWVAYPWKTPDGQFEVRVVALTGSSDANQARVLFRQAGVEPSVREWSADGTELLTVLARNDGTMQVALVSTSEGSARLIKDLGVSPALGMSLSPDGRFVVYDHPQKTNPRMRDLFVVATDGSGEWPLVEHPASDTFPYWMVDGRRVLFTSDRTGALGLWMIRVADGQPVGDPEVVSRDMGRMTPIGPTNTGAFFYRFETGLVDVYTASVDPSSQTVIGKPQPVLPNRVGSNISSDWSADGRRLAYVKIRNPAGAAQADLFSRALTVRDAETGEERDLWPPLAFFIAPRWAPDGRSILVQGVDAKRQAGIHRVDAATAQIRPPVIPNESTAGVGWPRFTPDGKALLYTRDGAHLISHDLASGRDTTVLDLRAIGLDHFSPGPIGTPFGMSPTGQIGFSAWTGWGKKASTVLEVAPPGGIAFELLRTHAQEPLIFQGWTPDGLNILFTKPASRSSGEQSTVLWRIPAAGGEPLRIELEMVGLRDVHVDATGTRLTFTAGWQSGDVRVMEHSLPNR